MPGIYAIRLADASVRVGPQFIQVQGYGDSDKFSVGPASDVGAFTSGIDGDTLHTIRRTNGWMLTLTLLQGSAGVTLLNGLHTTLGVFDVSITYGLFSLTGVMNMINAGEMAASLGTQTRTMTFGISKISGNTDAAPGEIRYIS